MKILTLLALLALLCTAASAAKCSPRYLHSAQTTPYVPCLHISGGCTKNEVFLSNYCANELIINPGVNNSFSIPAGAENQKITLGGFDPTECVGKCVFFNESLMWQRNDSCAQECAAEANKYNLDMMLDGTYFTLNARAIEYEKKVSSREKTKKILVNYLLPLLIVLFLMLQWHVYNTDKFLFDDYALRNLVIPAGATIAYIILVYAS